MCSEAVHVGEQWWLAGCMGFYFVRADSFFHAVASPSHSSVTIFGDVHMKYIRTEISLDVVGTTRLPCRLRCLVRSGIS